MMTAWTPVTACMLARKHWSVMATGASIDCAWGWAWIADRALDRLYDLQTPGDAIVQRIASGGGRLHILATLASGMLSDKAAEAAVIIAEAAVASRWTCAPCGKPGYEMSGDAHALCPKCRSKKDMICHAA